MEEGEEAELPEVASPHRDMMGGGGGGGTSRGGAESTSSSGTYRVHFELISLFLNLLMITSVRSKLVSHTNHVFLHVAKATYDPTTPCPHTLKVEVRSNVELANPVSRSRNKDIDKITSSCKVTLDANATGALRMGSVQRASAWGGSAAGSRQSSMARMSSAGAGAHARATSTMSQGISPAGGTILEDGAASIYQDIDIPAPTSGLDGGRPQVCVAL